MFLSVLQLGSPAHPRLVISNQNGEYWDGKAWTPDQPKALLFLDTNEIGDVTEMILMNASQHLPVCQIFRLPLFIELRSMKGTDFLEVQEWLMKACRVFINFKAHGNGPIPESLGLIHLDAGMIEEMD